MHKLVKIDSCPVTKFARRKRINRLHSCDFLLDLFSVVILEVYSQLHHLGDFYSPRADMERIVPYWIRSLANTLQAWRKDEYLEIAQHREF